MYRRFLKRCLDLVFALAALPFFIVVVAIIGPMIYLEDRGPIFYCGPRLGRDGRVFRMYKLRTMKINAPDIRNDDGSTFNSEDDPRVTRIGRFLRKTSIDELPQILNVLRGEMSFVGPRPDLPEHAGLYDESERRKLEVRPGITGFSQAYYRNSIPWKQRIQHDCHYIDNLSAWLDARILLKTLASVVGRKGIYVAEHRSDVHSSPLSR